MKSGHCTGPLCRNTWTLPDCLERSWHNAHVNLVVDVGDTSARLPFRTLKQVIKIFTWNFIQRKKKVLPSALNVPLPSITLAHHPEEQGTASTPLHEEELSKLAPKAFELLLVVWSLSEDNRKGFLPVLDRLDVLSSGLRQSPNSPLERHLKQRFTAPVVQPQHITVRNFRVPVWHT